MAVITLMSLYAIPLFLLIVLTVATFKRLPMYELFVEGGKEGIEMAITLLPFLVGMMVAVTVLRSSGALEAFVLLLSPLLQFVGIPPDIIPLAFVRPISGTAALSMTAELTEIHGPESFIARLAATMQGSTDTTLYIITVYFGAVGIKKIRYALTVGLLADLTGLTAAFIIVKLVFSA